MTDIDHQGFASGHVVAGIVARLLELPRRAVVLAEDETHLNLLPHVRASWTLRTVRPQIPTPGTNRQVTVFGALEMTTGARVYRLGRRCAADFIALLDQVLRAFPSAPAIVMICDNDSIHHARKAAAYLEKHPLWVPIILSWPLTWYPPRGAGEVKFGIWLRENRPLGHLQYSCRYDSLTSRCSGYSAGLPCSPGLAAPRTPRS